MFDPFATAAAAAHPSTPDTELELRHERNVAKLPTVVDPITGEVHERIDELPSDQLAELLYRLRAAEADRKLARLAVDAELRTRLKRENRSAAIVGAYRLVVKSTAHREWDAETLRGVIADLRASGVDDPLFGDLFKPQPAKVDGNVARRLLDRLTGASRDVIANCFAWRDDKGGRLEIEQVPAELERGNGR